MRVLGIDPGFATTGFGVVERTEGKLLPVVFGAIRTDPAATQAERLAELRRALAEIVTTNKPEAAAVERLFFNANVRTAIAVGQASGVALATCAELGISVTDYTPPEVKQSVVGVGTASKKQVQAMVAALLGLAEAPESADAADACALAICHLHRGGIMRAIASARSASR